MITALTLIQCTHKDADSADSDEAPEAEVADNCVAFTPRQFYTAQGEDDSPAVRDETSRRIQRTLVRLGLIDML